LKITVELQGNTLAYENDAVANESEMGIAFSDGEEGDEYCYAKTWQDFIGTAFHLIQQTGGSLTLNGQQINAATFEDTNGSPVTKDTKVAITNSVRITLSELLK
jgi:hypothetical protein